MRCEVAHPCARHAHELARVAARAELANLAEGDFRDELERPMSRVLMARGPSRAAIGYVLGWRVVDELQILSLAVDPDWQRRGVASALLEEYFARLRAEGVRRVSLEVRVSNVAARALYQKLGMKPTGQRDRYYPGGEAALLFGAEL